MKERSYEYRRTYNEKIQKKGIESSALICGIAALLFAVAFITIGIFNLVKVENKYRPIDVKISKIKFEADENGRYMWCDVVNAYATTFENGMPCYVAQCAIVGDEKNLITCQPVTVDIRSAVGSMAKVAVDSEIGEYILMTEGLNISE